MMSSFQKLRADNEEMNFLYEKNLPKDLESKRSVATWQPSYDSPSTLFSINLTGPCEGLRLSKLNSADH